jgi:NAD(P)-dependent dehydrogenase (short-subunit alcohol dehydrogenase family)
VTLEDKVAVVTGGAQGIGRAIVERLSAGGATVVFLDVDEGRGQELASDLETAGSPVDFRHCDVTDESQVAAAFGATIERHGGVDVLVNNAGINAHFDAAAMTVDEWEHVFAIDLRGPWLCSKHALPSMREARGGSIVNIASIHAFMTTPGMFPYAAAKSGLLGLTRNLALDEARHGIRVNAVCPGFVETRLVEDWLESQPDPVAARREVLEVQPLGRIGKPEEIASLVAFLASDEAGFITGASILIDGGLSARFAT